MDDKQEEFNLAEEYAAAPRAPLTLRQTIAVLLRKPEAIKLQMATLNGESPCGNSMMDRGLFARGLRAIGEKYSLPIPDKVKDVKVARVAMQEQKRVLPMTRTGRFDMERLFHKKAEALKE